MHEQSMFNVGRAIYVYAPIYFTITTKREVVKRMIVYGERRKVVVFNLNNELDRSIYELACQTNFSKLVKEFLKQQLEAKQDE